MAKNSISTEKISNNMTSSMLIPFMSRLEKIRKIAAIF